MHSGLSSMARILALSFSLLAVLVSSQSCDNYGVSTNAGAQNTTCACPAGFGGDTCALAACGGTIFEGTSRQYSPNSTSGLPFSNITSCACQDGWTGLGCNGASGMPSTTSVTCWLNRSCPNSVLNVKCLSIRIYFSLRHRQLVHSWPTGGRERNDCL